MRKSGMLMPVSALPGAYGIGCFSKEAYEFVDIKRSRTEIVADPAAWTDRIR